MSLCVLEFGDNAAAGYCGRLFALWGARVIRVDLPQRLAPAEVGAQALAAYAHADKERLALDYESADGHDLLRRLARSADVVVTDASPRALDALGWPDLGRGAGVRVSITPFGLTGPRRDWEATGATLLALGGYSYLIGDRDKAPLTLPGHYVEHQSGQYAYVAALAAHLALKGADSAASPAVIDVSMLEVVASLSQFTTVMWTFRGEIRSRHGNDWENIHPLSLYPCKDGFCAIAIVPPFWPAFVRMLDAPELLEDPRFALNTDRIHNRAALDEVIRAYLRDKTMAELLELGQRQFRVPVGVMRSMADLLADPHLEARAFWDRLALPDGRVLRAPGPAFRFAGETPARQRALRRPVPADSALAEGEA